MGTTAFIFPGQGSQYVGMGKDLFERSAEARALFEEADRVLGFSLSGICFGGPEEVLKQTKNTQPAIFLHSMALVRLIDGTPAGMAAGHSLGEYSALVFAGALEFEDGLRIVRLRGELMQRAGEEARGTMAAIVGLEAAETEQICAEASPAGIVQCANYNSTGQIVVSGSVTGVRKAMELAKARGAKMVRELVVSGAFHSPLMERARDGLKAALAGLRLSDARIPVYANVTGRRVQEAGEIRTLLERQLTSAVRWDDSVRNMVSDGASEFVEVGPGKVLQGLVKRISDGASVRGIDKFTDLEKTIVQ